MAELQAAFRADCMYWNGYKPCDVQKADSRPDCVGCDLYEPGPVLYPVMSRPFDAGALAEAKSVGVVEMGGLGSVLRTTAVTRAVRQINPSAAITWFTHERGADLLRYVPGVEAVDVDIDGVEHQGERVRGLDVVFNFELAPAAKAMVRHARRVGGFALNVQGNFSGVMPHAEYMQRLQIDDALRKDNRLTMQEILLGSVGLGDQPPRYDVELQPDNYARAKHVLADAFGGSLPESVVGLNIGTSEKGMLRRWPPERHAELALELADSSRDVGVAILSGPEDEVVRQRVISVLGTVGARNIAVLPVVEVGDFMAVLSKLQVVVTSDTFGMHAAKSQGTPTVALAGPMPHRELELTPTDKLLGPMLDCSPCYHRCSQLVVGQCMQNIEVWHAFDSVMKFMAQ